MAEMTARERDLEEENLMLRFALWVGHGHSGLYGDDGEMQCAKCCPQGAVDYKRGSAKALQKAFLAAVREREGQP
jgi:hypothetical protein